MIEVQKIDTPIILAQDGVMSRNQCLLRSVLSPLLMESISVALVEHSMCRSKFVRAVRSPHQGAEIASQSIGDNTGFAGSRFGQRCPGSSIHRIVNL